MSWTDRETAIKRWKKGRAHYKEEIETFINKLLTTLSGASLSPDERDDLTTIKTIFQEFDLYWSDDIEQFERDLQKTRYISLKLYKKAVKLALNQFGEILDALMRKIPFDEDNYIDHLLERRDEFLKQRKRMHKKIDAYIRLFEDKKRIRI